MWTRLSRFLHAFACLIGPSFLLSMIVMLPASAQEFRGSITGIVLDATGAVIPGVKVRVTNAATNVATEVVTNETGNYAALFLVPGIYTVSAEADGFKQTAKKGIQVGVADQLRVDVQMELGDVTQTVTVTAESAPLLPSNTASAGQTISARMVSEMPLQDGNSFIIARLSPGIAFYGGPGDLKSQRAQDDGGTSRIQTNGVQRNEYLIDGAPNGKPTIVWAPPVDAVEEVKVTTVNFDAQVGRTAGGTINMAMKGGNNRLAGTLSFFNRPYGLQANDFFVKQTQLAQGKPNEPPPYKYKRYGATIGGPVILPKLYSGKDRTFFFLVFEDFKERTPRPGTTTVPTDAMRKGDFSQLLGAGFTMYDPYTAQRLPNGRIQRDPLSCGGARNVICSNRLSPIAQKFLDYYPKPSQPGDADGRNNLLIDNTAFSDYRSIAIRVDHNLRHNHRLLFRYSRGNYYFYDNGFGEINGVRVQARDAWRTSHGATIDQVITLSPGTVLNVRAGFTIFITDNVTATMGKVDQRSFGFSQRTMSYFGSDKYMPTISITDFPGLSAQAPEHGTVNQFALQPTLTKVSGNHLMRVGWDYRNFRNNSHREQQDAGAYSFASTYTSGPLDTSPSYFGQGMVAFLLGQPSGGYMERKGHRSTQQNYHSIFFQDDWKATRKLTLNLGIRWEYEAAPTERYNRITRGFDWNTPNPVEAAAKAAYAATPIPEISPSAFRVMGGLIWADERNRSVYQAVKSDIQPLAAFAYRLNDKTVIRGGSGMHVEPLGATHGITDTTAFDRRTDLLPTVDNGLTFKANFYDGWPDGLLEPEGPKPMVVSLGTSISPARVTDRRSKKYVTTNLTVQRELPGQIAVEIAWVNNIGYNLLLTQNLNSVPNQYLSTSATRDQARIDYLSHNVTNPFRGLIPGTSLNNATVQRRQLLAAYPQYSGFTDQRFDGRMRYNSLQFRAEKRFSRGYMFVGSYSYARAAEKYLLNAADKELTEGIASNDLRHRIAVAPLYELPFGRGRRFGASWNRARDWAMGGWQIQALFQRQTRAPINIGNRYYNGDPGKLRIDVDKSRLDNALHDTAGFYFWDDAVKTNGVIDPVKQRNDPRINLADNLITLLPRYSGLRGQPLLLLDVSAIKQFVLKEGVKLDFRAEVLNAPNWFGFNDPNLDPRNANFGRVTSQGNRSRMMQFGFKLVF